MSCNVEKLIGFKTQATYARASILGFNAVLRNKEGRLARGDEVTKDLGIEDDIAGSGSHSRASLAQADNHEGKTCPTAKVNQKLRLRLYLRAPI